MSISNYLNKIKTAIYGKDVRSAIHDAIKECYDNASINHDNVNMEVKLARGDHKTLNDRLDRMDASLNQSDATDRDLINKLDSKLDKDGTAKKAKILESGRNITLSGAVTGSVNFNGGSDVVIETNVNHTHNYLPLTGGTLTGQLNMGGNKIKGAQGIWHDEYEYIAHDFLGNTHLNGCGKSVRIGYANTDYIRFYQTTVNHAESLVLIEPILARKSSLEHKNILSRKCIDELFSRDCNKDLKQIYKDTEEGVAVNVNLILRQLIEKVNELEYKVSRMEARTEVVE